MPIDSADERRPPGWVARHRRPLLIGGPVLVLLVVAYFYFTGGRYVSTDDADIHAATVQISTEVDGRIESIAVHDNQYVRRGQLLFTLQQNRFLIAVADAKAKLAQARFKIPALVAAYRQHEADVAAAKTTLAFQTREFARQTQLAAQGISSRAQLDQAKNNFETAQQQLAAAQQEVASALADLGGDAATPVDAQPIVRQAAAALDHADLELSYTTVRAPIDGIVAKVDQIQVGDHVDAAKPLFALISRNNVWVEANFKETDLTYVRSGQTASVSVDAYPGRSFSGHVLSTSPGTGSSFSLLPPENSSGNWVKVVQRVPVRISLENVGADTPLSTGMSVEVEVDTEHHRSLAVWE